MIMFQLIMTSMTDKELKEHDKDTNSTYIIINVDIKSISISPAFPSSSSSAVTVVMVPPTAWLSDTVT